MKLLLLALVTLASVNTALACSPARYPYIYNYAELSTLMQADKVSAAITSVGGASITNIAVAQDGYTFTLANGCFVKADVLYAPGNGGLCPSVKDINVVTGCR